ncbi:hypothetical protein B566_EDAN012988 [Ephemera danica]|nr:hypothetical protein B566_EDAN012988 [Ephemera danica]
MIQGITSQYNTKKKKKKKTTTRKAKKRQLNIFMHFNVLPRMMLGDVNSLFELHQLLADKKDCLFQFLQDESLLHSSADCPKMMLGDVNSLFELHQLLADKKDCLFQFLQDERISNNAVYQVFEYVRDICSWQLLQVPEEFRFGGPDKEVEIFLTQYSEKRNDESGILVIYCREDERGALQILKKKDEDTVIPMIKECVLPGSTVYSDISPVYKTLPLHGYKHLTAASLRKSENQKSGRKLTALNVLHSKNFDRHLDVLMWRDIYGRDEVKKTFKNILDHIGSRYELPRMMLGDVNSLFELHQLLADKKDCMFQFLQDESLLHSSADCPKCGRRMCLQNFATKKFQFMWRCSKQRCRRQVSVTHDSFFHKSLIDVDIIIVCIYLWCAGLSSKVYSEKRNDESGILVIYCREDERGALQILKKKDEDTVIPMIKECVLPGSTVYSDISPVYKTKLTATLVLHSKNFDRHLDVLMWQEIYGRGDVKETFKNILDQISSRYETKT